MDRIGRIAARMPIWVAVAILLGTGVLFRVAGGQGRSVAPPVGDAVHSQVAGTTPSATTATFHARRNGRSVSPENEAVTPYLLPGDDYAAVTARLAPLVDSDDVALFLMSEAVTVCARPLSPDWRDRARNPKGRAFLAWKESFCNGHLAATDASDSYHRMRMSRLVLRHANWKEDDDRGVEANFDAVLESESVDDMVIASTMLTVSGNNDWNFGNDLVQGTAQASRLPRYQQVAIDDLQCARTGGCGPNGLRTAMFCLMNPVSPCHPGQSVYDTWNDEFTPAELDIILAIKQRILDERSRRQSARANATGP
jgi:hypothetical protein